MLVIEVEVLLLVVRIVRLSGFRCTRAVMGVDVIDVMTGSSVVGKLDRFFASVSYTTASF